jgi:hypothetical protein
VTRSGTTISATYSILVASTTASTTIGTVTVAGSTTGVNPFTATYTASISGTATDLVYAWSVPIVPTGGSVAFSATNASTTSATFSAAGTYTLSCRVASQVATDRTVDLGVTFTVATDTCTAAAHGLLANDEISFVASSGTLPTGLLERTPYYVRATGLAANTFTVSAAPGGTAIDLTGTATGSYQVTRLGKTDLHTVVVS